MKEQMAVGARLREAREARGETIAALARRAGVDELWLCRIETGAVQRIRQDWLTAVATALNLDVLSPVTTPLPAMSAGSPQQEEPAQADAGAGAA